VGSILHCDSVVVTGDYGTDLSCRPKDNGDRMVLGKIHPKPVPQWGAREGREGGDNLRLLDELW